MRSPFPGWDPYLEGRWSDVHATLVAFIKEALQLELPRDLRARTEQRVLLEATNDDESLEPYERHAYRPDVALIETGLHEYDTELEAGGVLTLESVWVESLDGPVVDRSVHIVDVSSGNRLITAIEVLSPWNKLPGRLNASYMKKLDDYARAGVSVVEIDLLHGLSRDHLAVPVELIAAQKRSPYYVGIRRGWDSHRWQMVPLDPRKPLPAIPIPLRHREREIVLPLQPLVDRVYVAGGHDDIDYAKAFKVPLGTFAGESLDDWADKILREAGKR